MYPEPTDGTTARKPVGAVEGSDFLDGLLGWLRSHRPRGRASMECSMPTRAQTDAAFACLLAYVKRHPRASYQEAADAAAAAGQSASSRARTRLPAEAEGADRRIGR